MPGHSRCWDPISRAQTPQESGSTADHPGFVWARVRYTYSLGGHSRSHGPHRAPAPVPPEEPSPREAAGCSLDCWRAGEGAQVPTWPLAPAPARLSHKHPGSFSLFSQPRLDLLPSFFPSRVARSGSQAPSRWVMQIT